MAPRRRGWRVAVAIFAATVAVSCANSDGDGGGGGGGGTGNPPPFTNVSNSAGNSIQPAMVYGLEGDGDREIFLVWTEVVSGNSEVYFNRTLQSGTQWRTTTENVSDNVGASVHPKVGFTGGPVIDDTVGVVWDDNSLGDREILFSRKRGSGAFETPINLSNSAGISSNPAIAMPDIDLFLVVWQEELGGTNFEIFAARSIDGGASFGAPINVSNTAANSALPAVVKSGNDFIAVWTESGTTAKILAARSTDGGMSFGTPFEISGGVGVTGGPALAANGGRVRVAWSDLNEIYVVRSDDFGVSFGTPVNYSNDAGNSISPAVAVSGSDEVVVWEDVASNDIFLAVSNAVAQFIAPINLSGANASAGGSGGSFPPAIAVPNGYQTAYVAWSDNTQSASIEIVVDTYNF